MTELFTWLEESAMSTWVREAPTIWAFATILTLHTFGMGVLVGASAVVSLRLLGVARTIPLAGLRTLFRVMWVGFWLNLVTGSVLFAADASARGTQGLFYVKLLFVATGVTTIILIKRRLYSAKADPVVVSGATKNLAILSLLVWVVAITAGRLLAYVQ
ncbi:MAG: hypothetical protein M3537_08530 [Chloroflexota bacterium]|nr:hypothetical protein [Chloroflexota bacterium]